MSKKLYFECRKCKKTILTSSNKCQHCGARQYKRRILKWLSIFIVAVFLIRLFSELSDMDEQPATIVAENNPSSKENILNQIKLEYSWSKEGFGSVMNADFVIENTSAHDIKDIVITCEHYSLSKTKIDSNTREIFEIFPANSTKQYDDFNMGFIHEQANTSSCSIENFEMVN